MLDSGTRRAGLPNSELTACALCERAPGQGASASKRMSLQGGVVPAKLMSFIDLLCGCNLISVVVLASCQYCPQSQPKPLRFVMKLCSFDVM